MCSNADSEQGTEAWIGLWKQASVPTVEWSDGSPVTLTLWHQYHPPHNLTATPLCAKVDSKVGNYTSGKNKKNKTHHKLDILFWTQSSLKFPDMTEWLRQGVLLYTSKRDTFQVFK